MDNEALFKRIKELTEAKGITIAELERKVGASNHTIARWNKSTPGVDKLQKVAKYLGTTIDYLVTGEKEDLEKTKILARDLNKLTDTQTQLIQSLISEMKGK